MPWHLIPSREVLCPSRRAADQDAGGEPLLFTGRRGDPCVWRTARPDIRPGYARKRTGDALLCASPGGDGLHMRTAGCPQHGEVFLPELERLSAAAKSADMSINGFIKAAINEKVSQNEGFQ